MEFFIKRVEKKNRFIRLNSLTGLDRVGIKWIYINFNTFSHGFFHFGLRNSFNTFVSTTWVLVTWLRLINVLWSAMLYHTQLLRIYEKKHLLSYCTVYCRWYRDRLSANITFNMVLIIWPEREKRIEKKIQPDIGAEHSFFFFTRHSSKMDC